MGLSKTLNVVDVGIIGLLMTHLKPNLSVYKLKMWVLSNSNSAQKIKK